MRNNMEKLNGQNLVSQVEGKVVSVDTFNKKDGSVIYRNILRAPARNEYESPNTVCVLSSRRLGDMDSIVQCAVNVRGRYFSDRHGQTRYSAELWEINA
jgi:hypothetical protein